MTPTEILPGVHRLGTQIVNWYLVEDEGGLTAVDAGLPKYAPQLAEALSTLGRRREELKAVLLTHGHSDHTGAAAALAESGARVFIHPDDEQIARNPKPPRNEASIVPYLRHARVWRFFWHMTTQGALKPPPLGELELFADGNVLDDVPGTPTVVHTPGHTHGHCALHFERHGALFVGDLLCTRNIFTGREGPQVMPAATNVNSAESLSSLSQIEDLAASVVLPGHGDPFPGRPSEAVAAARRAGVS